MKLKVTEFKTADLKWGSLNNKNIWLSFETPERSMIDLELTLTEFDLLRKALNRIENNLKEKNEV